MIRDIYQCLKHYFKKTYFYSELLVIFFICYIFIYKVSPFTWNHNTFMIDINAAIIFSCLLVCYRIFISDLDLLKEYLTVKKRIDYILSRTFACILINSITVFIAYACILLLRPLNYENLLLSLLPIFINIFIGTVSGVLFSPVVLSIHQVIHGIFIIAVGINMSAIGSLFQGNIILNYIFQGIHFIFPPVEYIIKNSISNSFDHQYIIYTIWGLFYSIILFYASINIFKKKELKFNENNILIID